MTRAQRDPWRGTRLGYASESTIATCTRLRRAGDWRGARAAAGFHVDVDLADVSGRYGTEAARQLETDLRDLAPDLLWQYLPDQYHRLLPWDSWGMLSHLTHPTGATPTAPALAITFPQEPDVPRRPRLTLAESDWLRPLTNPSWPVWCWRADAVTGRRDAYSGTDSRVADEVASLRDGDLSPDELHPLVHDALYPGRTRRPVLTRWEWPAVRVRCGTVWHEVRIGGGRLNTPSHDDTEIAREFAFGGLGGAMHGCASAVRAWRTGRGRLPKRLRWQRADFFLHAYYGHTDDVLAMLDAGFDVAARDGAGRTLMHYLGRVDHRRLVPRLRGVGLPPDTRDHEGRTPLGHAVELQAEEVVALLLDAGADPDVVDARRYSPIGWQVRQVEDHRRRAGRPAGQSPPSSILARLREHAVG
ncbi:MAG TPA: ankyrin repeat domain-containing protein [Rugosimonospora sp.]